MSLTNDILLRLYAHESFAMLDDLAADLPLRQIEQALAAIAQHGHRLEYSPTAGVRLARPVRVDAFLIEHELCTRRVGRNVICFEQVGSTNDVAFDSARQAGADGLVVLAESQRAGRGRLGRQWVSPPGANVLMSVLLTEGDLPTNALTLAAGVAAAEGIEAATGLDCQLKWPNDVLLDGRKLCGVLVEVRRAQKRQAVVIGMGINANAAPPAGAVARPAACLREALGHEVERIDLARHVLRSLDTWVARAAAGELGLLHERWMARCGMMNQRVTVTREGRRYTGRVLDIQPLAGLVLGLDSGQRVELPAESSSVEM